MTLTQLQRMLLQSSPAEAKAVSIAICVFCEELDPSEWPATADGFADLQDGLYENLADEVNDLWVDFGRAADRFTK